jgi:phage baseplate assembly protein W
MLAVSQMQGIKSDDMFNSYGGTVKEKGNTKLKEDIELLLKQEKYKFFPDPEFGSEIMKYLFEPMTPATGELIRTDVYSLVSKYYPDLIINFVDVTMSENRISIVISLSYTDSGSAEQIQVIFDKEDNK